MSGAFRRACLSYWNVCLGAGGDYWLNVSTSNTVISVRHTNTDRCSKLLNTLWRHDTTVHVWGSSRLLKNWNETLIKTTWLIYRSGVRNAAEGRFCLFFKTGTGHRRLTPYSMVTERSVLGAKRPGRDVDHSSGAAPTPNSPYDFVACEGKGKGRPVTSHEGPEGE
jgi:hypothetical protein